MMLQPGKRAGAMAFRALAPLRHTSQPTPDPNKANLGDMVQQLRRRVPHMLQASLPKQMLSSDVLLRVAHHDQAVLPVMRGHVGYYAAFKAAQWVLLLVVLSPEVRIHVQSLKVCTDDTIHTVYPGSTKICIKWSTCLPQCPHLGPDAEPTLVARLGSHTWKGVDFTQSIGLGLLKGLATNPSPLDRVISGIFIFELDKTCTQVRVHTIDNLESIEKEPATVPRLLRVV